MLRRRKKMVILSGIGLIWSANMSIKLVQQVVKTYNYTINEIRTIRAFESDCKRKDFYENYFTHCRSYAEKYHYNFWTLMLDVVEWEMLPWCGPLVCSNIFTFWNILYLSLFIFLIERISKQLQF